MKDIEIAKQALEMGSTCAMARGGQIVYAGKGIGVKPLLAAFDAVNRYMQDSSVADTVVGKAAAVLMVLAEVSKVYGVVMSKGAVEYLKKHDIPCCYGELVEYIENRTGDDMCPLEKAVSDIEDPQEALVALRSKIAQLMAGK